MNLLTPDDPAIASLFSAIRGLLIAIGGVMAANGLASSATYRWVEILAGSILTIGPLIWGVVVSVFNIIEKRKAVANGVQAGLNLAVSGAALDVTGARIAPIQSIPKPVTLASAADIVQNFGPPVPLAAK